MGNTSPTCGQILKQRFRCSVDFAVGSAVVNGTDTTDTHTPKKMKVVQGHKKDGLEMVTWRQAYNSKRTPFPRTRVQMWFHRPPRRRDHAANVWIKSQSEHVSMLPCVCVSATKVLTRWKGECKSGAGSWWHSAVRQDPLWQHLCSAGPRWFEQVSGAFAGSCATHHNTEMRKNPLLSRYSNLLLLGFLSASSRCIFRSGLGPAWPPWPGISFHIA